MPVPRFTVRALYVMHFVVELILGAIKLRGTYSGVECPGIAKFARHHGVSLLALAALGGLVLYRRLEHTVTGEVASSALAVFHAGTMGVMIHALNFKVVAIHAPFALAFGWHALCGSVSSAPDLKRP